MTQEVSSHSRNIRFTVNSTKIKVMTNALEIAVLVDGTEPQYIPEYVYLGQIHSFKHNRVREISRRIASAWNALWRLKFILRDKLISRRLKFESPGDLYISSASVWLPNIVRVNSKQKTSFQVCQRKMQRKLPGVSLRDRIPNKRKNTSGTMELGKRAMKTKWQCGGHVAKLYQTR